MALFDSRSAGAFDNSKFNFAELAATSFPGSLTLNNHFNGRLHGIFGDDRLDIAPVSSGRPDVTFLGSGFTKDATALTGGQITAMFVKLPGAGESSLAFSELNLSVVSAFAVGNTVGLKDDHALVKTMFAGNDTFLLGGKNDTITAGAGDDHVKGGGGDDHLSGNGGSDVIDGGAGADVITGGAGHDVLTGGTEADTFVFNSADGADVITDYDQTADFLRLNVGTSGTGFTLDSDVAGDAVLHFGTTAVTLTGQDLASLDMSHILMA